MRPASQMLRSPIAVLAVLLGIAPAPTSRHDSYSGGPLSKTENSTVSFAMIGDYGSAGQYAADVARLVHSWQVDFILTAGDNNYPDGEASTIDANIGQYYSDYIHPYSGAFVSSAEENRFFPALGNHDWRSITCDSTGCSGPYLDFFTLPGNERYYDFVRGDVHVFVLDSDRSEPDGITSASRQAEWLRDALGRSTASWKIVTLHHAPYSSADHGSAETLQWPYAEWGADIVLAGHDHVYERIQRDGVVYIVNGLGGRSIYSFGLPVDGSEVRYNDDYGALRVVADATQITLEFVSRAGVTADQFVVSRHRRTGTTQSDRIAERPRLLAVYPNPLSTSARISYDLPYSVTVSASVYDVLGRQVQSLVEESMPPGEHDITFDATSLPAGLYFYRLEVGSHVETRSVVVLR